LYCRPPLLITANMIFHFLLSSSLRISQGGYVDGLGGAPSAQFIYFNPNGVIKLEDDQLLMSDR
jgi:hypothetical protein